jgi:hypothetical protein
VPDCQANANCFSHRAPRYPFSRLVRALPAPSMPGKDFLFLQERASLIAEALEEGRLDAVAAMTRCSTSVLRSGAV